MRSFPLLAATVVALGVSACSSNDTKRAPTTREFFSTQISDDGSKQFNYAVYIELPQGRKRGGMRGGMGTGAAGGAGDRGPGATGGDMETRRAKMRARMEEKLTSGLEAKLIETEYCREGYLELQRVMDRGRMTIRGECKEGATAEDRANFPNEQLQQPSMLQQFETLEIN